jgi:uncharacterized protein (DUF305 family)
VNKKLLTIPATAIAATIALAGCSTGSGQGTMPGMSHGSSGPMSSGAASNMAPDASADHNAADIMFAQMMIPHHAQAVEMSDLMLAKADLPQAVASLAARIKAAQAPEIQQMEDWLKRWNQPTGMMTDHAMPGSSMMGMVDQADLDKLKAAQGTEAVRLFLSQMIAHHEGAIAMAKTETSSGKHADAVTLSKAIITAQEAEILEMKALLAAL